MRTVLSLGFEVPPRSQPALASSVATRLAESRGVDPLSPVTVTMQDRTAILRGVVPTDHARTIAERLAMLEPGVSSVQNELTVAPVTSSETARESTATATPRPAARVEPGPQTSPRASRSSRSR
jgi:osmotically-inducible protein OsmY